jgi:hypothetical protein
MCDAAFRAVRRREEAQLTLVCPTDVVEAPVEVVWGLLTDPAGWGDFFDLRVRAVHPPGPAHVGQCVHAESGPRFAHLKITFRFTRIDVTHHGLGMRVALPLGVVVTEEMSCASLAEDRCRVTYGCDFSFPPGLHGSIVRALFGREVQVGPIESLRRLKAAAEKRHLQTSP